MNRCCKSNNIHNQTKKLFEVKNVDKKKSEKSLDKCDKSSPVNLRGNLC